MTGISDWLGNIPALQGYLSSKAEDRSMDTARTIADNPVSIVLIRKGVLQAAQEFRIEPYRHPVPIVGMNGLSAKSDAVLLGNRGNPDQVKFPDSVVLEGDRFFYLNQMYNVMEVIPGTKYRLIAIAQAYAG